MDVTGIAPIRGAYTLALTSPADGQISGQGVLRVEQRRIPVKARGTIVGGKVALTLIGGKTVLKATNGQFNSLGFTAAKWTAQGFGALRKGRNLKINLAR